MPCATSPSAIACTSSGCMPQKSAICVNVNAVFSISHTAVAFGINGSVMACHFLRAAPHRHNPEADRQRGEDRGYDPRPGAGQDDRVGMTGLVRGKENLWHAMTTTHR